jgi:hypothetical protein
VCGGGGGALRGRYLSHRDARHIFSAALTRPLDPAFPHQLVYVPNFNFLGSPVPVSMGDPSSHPHTLHPNAATRMAQVALSSQAVQE